MHKLVVFMGINFDKTQAVSAPMGRTSPPRPRSRSARCEFVSTDRSDLTEEELVLRARYLARKQVYDVIYLSRRRAWGPYQQYHKPLQEGEALENEDLDTDSDDSDFVPREVVSEDEEMSADEEEEEEEEDHAPPAAIVHKPSPEPEHLCADWIHLAAIRMDVQSGLQNHAQWADLKNSLTSWDGVCAGAWISEQPADSNEWDWAGVEGVWRSVQLYDSCKRCSLTDSISIGVVSAGLTMPSSIVSLFVPLLHATAEDACMLGHNVIIIDFSSDREVLTELYSDITSVPRISTKPA